VAEKVIDESVNEIENLEEKTDNVHIVKKDSGAQSVQKELGKIVGEGNIKEGKEAQQLFYHDISQPPKSLSLMYKTVPDILVTPSSAEEISEIMKLAIKGRIPVIPKGSATGGFGGSLPVQGGIIVDLRRMNKVLEIDNENMVVTVEAGINWSTLNEKLIQNKLFLGANPFRPNSTIGGWINTDEIGFGSYKYGNAKDQIRSLQVVLPNSKIINTGFPKVIANNSGYDLNGLFVGSRGTFGIVTKASLCLHPYPAETKHFIYTFNSTNDMANAVGQITKTKLNPQNIGFADKNHFKYLKKMNDQIPLYEGVIDIVFEGVAEEIERNEKAIDSIAKQNNGSKQDKSTFDPMWTDISNSYKINLAGARTIPHEIFIPVTSFEKTIQGVNEISDKLKVTCGIVGSVPDRNTVSVMTYFSSDEGKVGGFMLSFGFMNRLSKLSYDMGGRPAGVDLYFGSNLKKLHGSDAVSLLYDIKSAVDPHDIMNPGKLTEGLTRYGMPLPKLTAELGVKAALTVTRLRSKKEL
jgi:glycolate oxidase